MIAEDDITKAVDEGLLSDILSPYKPHCRYLESAEITYPSGNGPGRDAGSTFLASIEGSFGIAASCYIEDTGHLNSVELNICYNQIMYVCFAQCVVDRRIPALRGMTLDEYRRRQLPDVLIHDLSSTFKRPIDARRFRGDMTVTAAIDRRRFILFKTHSSFWDEEGGAAEADVSLALVDRSGGEDW